VIYLCLSVSCDVIINRKAKIVASFFLQLVIEIGNAFVGNLHEQIDMEMEQRVEREGEAGRPQSPGFLTLSRERTTLSGEEKIHLCTSLSRLKPTCRSNITATDVSTFFDFGHRQYRNFFGFVTALNDHHHNSTNNLI
jgi:hypothetical protein